MTSKQQTTLWFAAVVAGLSVCIFTQSGCGTQLGGLFGCAGLAAEAAQLATMGLGDPDEMDLQCATLEFELRALDSGCLDFVSGFAGSFGEDIDLDIEEERDRIQQEMADLGCE